MAIIGKNRFGNIIATGDASVKKTTDKSFVRVGSSGSSGGGKAGGGATSQDKPPSPANQSRLRSRVIYDKTGRRPILRQTYNPDGTIKATTDIRTGRSISDSSFREEASKRKTEADQAKIQKLKRTGVFEGSLQDYQRLVAPNTMLSSQVVKVKETDKAKDVLPKIRKAVEKNRSAVLEIDKRKPKPSFQYFKISDALKREAGIKKGQRQKVLTQGMVTKAEISKLDKFADRVINRIDSDGRIRSSMQYYKEQDKYNPYGKALFKAALFFGLGGLTKAAATPILLKVAKYTPRLYKLTEAALKTGEVFWYAGMPVRAIQTGGDPKKLALEFAGDVGFLAGLQFGGVSVKDISKTKVKTQDKAKEILKKYTDSVRPTLAKFKQAYKKARTKTTKAEMIAAWTRLKDRLPGLDFEFKPMGKKGAKAVTVTKKQKAKTKEKPKKKAKKKIFTEKDIIRSERIRVEKLRQRAIKKKQVKKESKEAVRVINVGDGQKMIFIDLDKLIKEGKSVNDFNKALKKANDKLGNKKLSDKKVKDLFGSLEKKPTEIEIQAVKKAFPKAKKASYAALFALLNPQKRKVFPLIFPEFEKANTRLMKALESALLPKVMEKLGTKSLQMPKLRAEVKAAIDQQLKQLSLPKQGLKSLQKSLTKQALKQASAMSSISKASTKQALKQASAMSSISKASIAPPPKGTTAYIFLPKLPKAKNKEEKKSKIIPMEEYLQYSPTLKAQLLGIKARRTTGTFSGLEERGIPSRIITLNRAGQEINAKKPLIVVAKKGMRLDGVPAKVREYKRRIPKTNKGKPIPVNVKILKKYNKLIKGYKRKRR